MSYFQVTFNEKILFDSVAYNPLNYIITPTVTITSIERIDDYSVKVNVSGFEYDIDYDIQIYNVRNIYGTAVFGVVPAISVQHTPFVILSASAIDNTTINVEFGGDIANSGAAVNPANYVITGDTTPSVSLVTYVDPNNVQLTIAETRNLGSYLVTVSNVQSILGTTLTVNAASFTGIGIAPRVSSATATDAATVRVVFDEAMSDTGLTTDGNYAFTSPGGATITVGSVAKINPTTVDITISGEMRTGISNYTVTVSNVTDLAGNTVDPLYNSDQFNGVGVAPQMLSAVASNPLTVEIIFDEPMNVVQLETFTNYTFDNGLVSSAAIKIGGGPTYTTVDVTVSEMSDGVNYTVTGGAALIDLVGNTIDPGADSQLYAGQGYPQVASATATDYNTIRIVFNESMTNNAALINTANYTFAGPTTLTSALVTRINATTVDVDTTQEMRNSGAYTVTVENVTDLDGNVISPAHKTAAFTGIGVAPQVSSATFIDPTHVDVLFNETVETTSAETAGNYIISGAGSPVVSSASKTAPNTVRLTIPFTASGNYVVTVSNVTDVAGNVIDPLHNTGSFAVSLATVTMFGGSTGTTFGWSPVTDGMYEWKNSDWAQKTPVRPTARTAVSMAYDSVRNVCVLFGGYDGAYLQDTWEWNGTTWTQKATGAVTKPSIRGYHSMVFDVANNKTFLFGGFDGATKFNDCYIWDGSVWVNATPVTKPTGRYSAGMAYDLSRNRAVLFGGQAGGLLQDTWEWDGSAWSEKASGAVTKPSNRHSLSLAYDPNNSSVLLFGGYTGSVNDETWTWNGSVWTQKAPATVPAARQKHSIVHDMPNNNVVLFGGLTAAILLNTTHIWNGSNWVLQAPGTSPTARMLVALSASPTATI